MARHETFTLDNETALHAANMRQSLMTAHSDGLPIAFTVQGRDNGIVTDRTGEIVGFVGDYGLSNEAVLVETDKGMRTFNVWLIRSIQVVGE